MPKNRKSAKTQKSNSQKPDSYETVLERTVIGGLLHPDYGDAALPFIEMMDDDVLSLCFTNSNRTKLIRLMMHHHTANPDVLATYILAPPNEDYYIGGFSSREHVLHFLEKYREFAPETLEGWMRSLNALSSIAYTRQLEGEVMPTIAAIAGDPTLPASLKHQRIIEYLLSNAPPDEEQFLGVEDFDNALRKAADIYRSTGGHSIFPWYSFSHILGIPGLVVSIVGPTHSGKTTVAIDISRWLVLQDGVGVLYLTTELSPAEIALRLVAPFIRSEDGSLLGLTAIKTRLREDKEYINVIRSQYPRFLQRVYIKNISGLSVDGVTAVIAAFKRAHPELRYVILDYFLDVHSNTKGRHGAEFRHIQYVARQLFGCFRREGVVGIILDQTRIQGIDNPLYKLPSLGSTWGTSALDQGAQVVIGICRLDPSTPADAFPGMHIPYPISIGDVPLLYSGQSIQPGINPAIVVKVLKDTVSGLTGRIGLLVLLPTTMQIVDIFDPDAHEYEEAARLMAEHIRKHQLGMSAMPLLTHQGNRGENTPKDPSPPEPPKDDDLLDDLVNNPEVPF